MSELAKNLWLIPLNYKLTGFTSFIGAWLYKGEKIFVVDVGPAATVPVLLKTLDELGVRRLDAVLLTHIHIDHAGGIGDFVSHFPDTPVVCHKSGLKHLANPDKLWEGSLKTLGDTARAYGPLLPVFPELLRDAADFREHDIEPLMTPGHAPHHVSYLFRDYLFGGETCGVYTELPDGDFYLRPATPPRFFLETSVKSIESLLEVPHKLFCFGHFGLTRDTPRLLEIHRQQISDWAHIIRNQMQKAEQGPDFQDHCIDVLLQKDPLLKSWDKLGPAIQERERFFLRNSVRGYVEYLREMGH